MIRLLAFLFLVSWTTVAMSAPKGVIVLVPGTGNSLAPGAIQKHPISKELQTNPYFSKDIIQILKKRNYEVFVIKGLSPAGKFEENGVKSLEVLSKWYLEKYPKRDMPITLIGHSAGGFYSLYMSHLNRTLPIRDIALLSVGLHGLRIAEILFPGDLKEPTINIPGLSFFIDVRGLPQFKPEPVKKFIAQLRLPPHLRLFSVGGSQPPSKSLGEVAEAAFLSPILKFTASLIEQECDGIVESYSAYAQGVNFNTTEGGIIQARALPKLHMRLEHPEQALDHRIFKILGTKNTEYILNTQEALYSSLIDTLEN